MIPINKRHVIDGKTFIIDQLHRTAGQAQKHALPNGLKWGLVPGKGWATLTPTDPISGLPITQRSTPK